MEKKLPILNVEGTDFLVDVKTQELRELANPENVISFLDMVDHGTHYAMLYDLRDKNFPPGIGPMDDQMVTITIPPMVSLDPAGMADNYGTDIETLKGKTDYEILVNQELVQLREQGVLPVIDIAGHPFYVDIRIGSLRPKDDFSTMGIQFSEIEDCLSQDCRNYWITYDPKSHQYIELDYTKIKAIPEGILVVEIPYEAHLDPVGYARKHGFDQKQILREHPPVTNMKARVVPWSETPVEQIIKDNLKKSERKSLPATTSRKTEKKRGRGL